MANVHLNPQVSHFDVLRLSKWVSQAIYSFLNFLVPSHTIAFTFLCHFCQSQLLVSKKFVVKI